MDTTSEPEKSEELAAEPNSIVAMWKQLWPLIISMGLFMLVGIAWYIPPIGSWCPQAYWITDFVLWSTWGATSILIVSRLISAPKAHWSLMVWIRYSIRTVLIVVGAFLVSFFALNRLILPNFWGIGVILYIGIAIIILVGRDRRRPTPSQALIWLTSLLLLIIIQLLALTIFSRYPNVCIGLLF